MKTIPHPFKSDRIILGIWDIIKLLIGRTISNGACKIRLFKIPEEYMGE